MRKKIRQIRQNHALEHATVAVMLERGVRPPLGGYSTSGGFLIWARVPEEAVAGAVREALGRLSGGRREMAVSPYCGTNLAVGALLASAAMNLLLGRGRKSVRRIPVAAAALVGAAVLGRPLGQALQRRYTTLADVDGVAIGAIRKFRLGSFNVFRISTTFGE